MESIKHNTNQNPIVVYVSLVITVFSFEQMCSMGLLSRSRGAAGFTYV